MIEPVDALVDAAVRAVRDAQVAESAARMGTVSAVQAGGTVTVSVADGTIPGVRLLGRLYAPTVGDVVEILRTQGGWVCLGALRTSSAPLIQRGNVTVGTGTDNTWLTANVTFPQAFDTVPTVVAVNTSAFTGPSATTISYSVSNITASGFVMRSRRSNSSGQPAPYAWIATAA